MKTKLKLSRSLVKKSTEAFLLALEIYNKPTVGYRAEAFSIFFSNSWELLLKAKLYADSNGNKLSIFRKKFPNKKRESITLDESLKKVFQNPDDPIRRNIEFVSDIRNEASHLIIQELDPYFSRAFQSGVTNYVNTLFTWFDLDINTSLNPGLISLISDKDGVSNLAVLKKHFSKEDFQILAEWVTKYQDLTNLGNQAALSIKHTLAIVRNPDKADYIISSSQGAKREAIVIEKQKNPDLTHPFNKTQVMEMVINRIPKNFKFNSYDFDAFVFTGQVKSKDKYFYKGKFSGTSQYSQVFIDDLVQALNQTKNNKKSWRLQYKKYLEKKHQKDS